MPKCIQSQEHYERPAMGLVFVKPQGTLQILRENKQSYSEAKLVDPAIESEEPTANEDPDSVFDTLKRLKNDEEYKADSMISMLRMRTRRTTQSQGGTCFERLKTLMFGKSGARTLRRREMRWLKQLAKETR
jgi:hypothetical protein